MKRKERRMIPNIEPHLLPVDDHVAQLVGDVLDFLPLAKLQPGSPDYIYLRIIGMGFQMEEKLKKIEVGLDPRKASHRWTKIEMWRMELGVK